MKKYYGIFDVISNVWLVSTDPEQDRWSESFTAARMFGSILEAEEYMKQHENIFSGCWVTIPAIFHITIKP